MKSLSLNTIISHFLVRLQHKEDKSQFNETEFINDDRSRSCQADVNQRIQRVQANYFIERRTFL